MSHRTPPSPLPVEPYFQRIRGASGFLHAVAEETDDGAFRLIFADWLEEEGHSPRADFIRLQCRMEQLPVWHPEHKQHQEQAGTLWEQHRTDWLEGLPEIDGLEWNHL